MAGAEGFAEVIARLTSLLTELTQKTEPADTQNVKITSATAAALTNVASSATNVTLLASNANRRLAAIFNDSTQALYVKFGATASTSSFTYKVLPASTLEFPTPIYTGIVDGLWDSANGNARVTEIT